MMTPPIAARKDGRLGWISLNRPSVGHAFNVKMSLAIAEVLSGWLCDDDVELVLIDHAYGSRGFCLGSDLISLARATCMIGDGAREFLANLYQLCYTISEYPKPIVTVIDGHVSGSAVGISLAASHQVATNKTSLMVTDSAAGFAPDCGATLHLAKLPNELGTWLALTSSKLEQRDVIAAGLATHYCVSSDLMSLKESLRSEGISALSQYRASPRPTYSHRINEIENAFQGDCAMEIKRRLEAGSLWARQQATKMLAKSPLSTKITLRQLRTARYLDSLEASLQIDFRVASRLVETRNFREGVRAVHWERDHCPSWEPNSLFAVNKDMVSKFFSPICEKELQLCNPLNLRRSTTNLSDTKEWFLAEARR